MIKKYGYFFLLPFLTVSCNSFSQNLKRPIQKVSLQKNEIEIIAPLPKILKEASGLYIDENKEFWSHNDDRYPILYCFDSTGAITKTIHLNHLNKGWEALASDKNNNVYIGGFGNNRNDRRDLSIFKVKSLNSISDAITQGETIKFQYEDQTVFPTPEAARNYDADALVAVNDSLYIFTKNRTKPFTGYTRVYRLPQTAGTYKATLVDSIFVGQGPMMDYWITGADISPDGKKLVLLGHDKIWLVRDFKGTKFSTGEITEIELPDYTHKAGVSFYNNNTLYVVDETELEILGGNLYKLDLSRFR